MNIKENIKGYGKQELSEKKLYNELKDCPKWQLVLISKVVHDIRKEKYMRCKDTKYGDLPRRFNEEQLRIFFKGIRNKTVRIAFLIQFFYGLRIGELKHLTYVENQNLLKIYNEKCNRTEYLPVHGKTIELIKYLPKMKKISGHYLRNKFRENTFKTKINYVYGHNTRGKDLWQFSSHSLRHTAITIFGKHIVDPIKCMKFSRHKANKTFGVLPIYSYYGLDELKIDLETAFKKYYDLI
jgi:integrase